MPGTTDSARRSWLPSDVSLYAALHMAIAAFVVLGMFLIGAFFRWIYRKYGEEAGFEDPYRRGLYVAILAVCWGIEGGIAAGVAGLVRPLVVATLVAFALERIGLLVRVSSPTEESVS